MLDIALKLIKKIKDNGFDAYIVGGFVRDYVLGIESNDVDVCTNAEPKDIRKIFKNNCLPNEAYGSVVVIFKKVRFEITTFRREIRYVNNRKPVEFEFISDLYEDLKRRDFRINTLCMDEDMHIIDLLDGNDDIKNREINTVGDSYLKFREDSLRILRAIRFATILNFRLSDDVKNSILENKHLVKKLSYDRKKSELNKIFTSKNVRYGVKLLIELGLDKELQLNNISDIKYFDDLMGIWALLKVDKIYPFTKNEQELMEQIRECLKLDNFDSYNLYKYGLYINSVVADIKNLDKKIIIEKYNNLPIKARNELLIDGNDIMGVLNLKQGKYLRLILDDIEKKVLFKKLENNKEVLINYVVSHYGNGSHI